MPTPAGRTSRSGRERAPAASTEAGSTAARGTKVTININVETEQALRTLAEREGVSITEAVRRLVGYGELLWRTTKIDGDEVLIRRGGKELERIHLI